MKKGRDTASSKATGPGQLCQIPNDIKNGGGEATVISEAKRQWFQSWRWCDKNDNKQLGQP